MPDGGADAKAEPEPKRVAFAIAFDLSEREPFAFSEHFAKRKSVGKSKYFPIKDPFNEPINEP